MNNNNLYDMIKEARLKLGLSQRELAQLIGVHHSVIARIEKGEISQPSINILINISRTLELSLVDMLHFYGYTYEELEEVGISKKESKE